MSNNQNTALVKPADRNPAMDLRRFLDSRKAALVTYGSKEPDRAIQIAVFEFANNESLRRCTPESIYTALAISSQLGLVPSSALGEAFLVPFKGKCTLIPGWKGLVKLAHRSKAIREIGSDVVYENDHFRIRLGTARAVEHEPALVSRGKIIGAYAYVIMTSGAIDVEWMPVEDLEKIRRIADGRGKPSSAYAEWTDQMYRKAPLRRLCKRLPLGEDYFKVAALDDLHDDGTPERVHEIIDIPIVEDAQPADEPPAQQPAQQPAPQGKPTALREKVGAAAAKARGEVKTITVVDELVAAYAQCTTRERHAELEARRAALHKDLTEDERDQLALASDEAPIGKPEAKP